MGSATDQHRDPIPTDASVAARQQTPPLRPMQNAADTGDADDDRSPSTDDQFRALLEGLRTSLPGVQVLFAFLLVAPFQRDFTDLGTSTRVSFLVAFFAAGAASVLLIAPSVHQRVRAPASGMPRRSPRHLRIATWLSIAGTLVMGVAIVATVFLVSTFVLDDTWAMVAAAALGGGLIWSWFFIPLVTFRH